MKPPLLTRAVLATILCSLLGGVATAGCGDKDAPETAAQKQQDMGTGVPPPSQVAAHQAEWGQKMAEFQAKKAAAVAAQQQGKPVPQ